MKARRRKATRKHRDTTPPAPPPVAVGAIDALWPSGRIDKIVLVGTSAANSAAAGFDDRDRTVRRIA